MPDVIGQKLAEYFSTGTVTDPSTNPKPGEIIEYAVEHAPLTITYEMVADFFVEEAAFKDVCVRSGLTVEQDPWTRNFTVKRLAKMKTYRFEVERYVKETIDVIADNEKDARQIVEWVEGDPPCEIKAYYGGVSEPRRSRSRILRKLEERADNQFG